MGRTRRVTRMIAIALLAIIASTATGAWAQSDVDIDVTIPETVSGPFEVSNAQLRWGLNEETGGGAFFGGCNFLSAGISGDAREARVWSDADVWGGSGTRGRGDHFASRDGNVRVEKPYRGSDGDVEYRIMRWGDRCEDAAGNRVGTQPGSSSGGQVVIEGGRGSVDPEAREARIEWDGAFTVVYYGGLTYWWVQDLVLEVTNGVGTITATAGGYGADMFDLSKWEPLPDTRITLADLSGVQLGGAQGFTTLPAYLGVRIDVAPDGPSGPQVRTGAHWGAFPQSFIDFQVRTGQVGYWYSSGGLVDPKKPTSPLRVNYDADDPGEIPDSGGTGPPAPALNPPGGGLPPTGAAGFGGPPPAGAAGAGPGVGAGAGGPSPGSAGASAGSGAGSGSGAGPGAGGSGDTVFDEQDEAFVLAAAEVPDALYGASRLIPDDAGGGGPSPRVVAATAGSALVALGGVAFVGFRRGWFVLPWSRS